MDALCGFLSALRFTDQKVSVGGFGMFDFARARYFKPLFDGRFVFKFRHLFSFLNKTLLAAKIIAMRKV